MDESNALVPVESTALMTPASRLPSIADIQARMQWMGDFRKVLVQYVETQMDPSRHMYSFESGSYKRITDQAEISSMLAKGQKPALNQDGIHNLMAVYECDIDDEHIDKQLDDDGHLTVTVKIWLRYFGTRRVVGYGTCSTRESKYAYRWVGRNRVPKDVDPTTLKTRTFEPTNRQAYTLYRLENEDLPDVYGTVVQQALKRSKSSAVKALPGVSEMFSTVGDPDEHEDEDALEAERQLLLQPLADWLRSLRASTQAKALLAVFGEPLRANDVPKLEADRLAWAGQVVAIATRAGITWDSPTLLADLKQALATSAAQAQAELTGAPAPTPAAPPAQSATSAPTHNAPAVPQERPQKPRTAPEQSADASGPPEGPLEAPRGLKNEKGQTAAPRAPQGEAWDLLRHNQDNAALPPALLERIASALAPLAPATDAEAQQLAGAVLDWLTNTEDTDTP